MREPLRQVAALYVDEQGCYARLKGVHVWGLSCDARLYPGPFPVVAHPPCQRWGRYATGGPSARVKRVVGDDRGCFESALAAVRTWGGVLEHPADSKAWAAHGLRKPQRGAGWCLAEVGSRAGPGWTCYVEQGHYGHFSRKATWLYAVGSRPPELPWGRAPNVLPEAMVARYGHEKARRIGVMAMVGGKDKTRIREATPPAFRDALLAIARQLAQAPQGRTLSEARDDT